MHTIDITLATVNLFVEDDQLKVEVYGGVVDNTPENPVEGILKVSPDRSPEEVIAAIVAGNPAPTKELAGLVFDALVRAYVRRAMEEIAEGEKDEADQEVEVH